METRDVEGKPQKKRSGDSPVVWVAFWLVVFLGLIVFNHVRYPDLTPGDLLSQSLLNSLPAAGVGVGLWGARRGRH